MFPKVLFEELSKMVMFFSVWIDILTLKSNVITTSFQASLPFVDECSQTMIAHFQMSGVTRSF